MTKYTIFSLCILFIAGCGGSHHDRGFDVTYAGATDGSTNSCTPPGPGVHAALDALYPDQDCATAGSIISSLGDTGDDRVARGLYAQHCQRDEVSARAFYLQAASAGATCRAWLNITSLSDPTVTDFETAQRVCGQCSDAAEKVQTLRLNWAITVMSGAGCASARPIANLARTGPLADVSVNAIGVVVQCDIESGVSPAAAWAAYGSELVAVASSLRGVDLAIAYGIAVTMLAGSPDAGDCARTALLHDDGGDPDWTAELQAAAAIPGGRCPF